MRRILSLLMLLIATSGLWAQVQLKGRVFDSKTNQPLQGAHVRVEGTFLSTISASDGSFSFDKIKNGKYQLTISFIGYSTEKHTVVVPQDKPEQIAMSTNAIMADEVVVAATRLSNQMPTAVKSISKHEITDLNQGRDLPYILENTPALVNNSDAGTGIGYTSFRIRGTDMSRINILINGVPVNDPESQQVYWVDIPDIAASADGIEVQRGVGTSVYGNSSFGAGLNLSTSRPNPIPFAKIETSAGSFNTLRNSATFSTGLKSNKLAFEGRLSRIVSDGYIDRASSNLRSFFVTGGYYGEKTMVKMNIFSGHERTYQAWEGVPGDSLESNRTFNPAGLYYDADGKIQYYKDQVDDYQQDYYQLFISHLLSDQWTLNIAGHYTRGYGYYESYKQDAKYSKFGLEPVIIGTDTLKRGDFVQRKYLDNHFGGGTFSLLYDNHNNFTFTYGGAYNYYHGDHYGTLIWAKVAPLNFSNSDQWYNNSGVKQEINTFIKGTYKILDRITFFGDIQYRYVDYKMDGIHDDLRNITQSHFFNFINPKAGVNYDIAKKHSVWLSLGIAQREPGRNEYRDADENYSPKSEYMTDIELGYTYTSNQLKGSLNGYFMNYRDQLVQTGEINNVGSAIFSNVDKSYRLGIEADASLLIGSTLKLAANAAISQNKIKDFVAYVDDWDTWGQRKEVLGTTDLAFSPSIVTGISLSYNPTKGVAVTLSNKYVGKQYIDNTSNDNRALDAYSTTNLSASYHFNLPKFGDIRLWGRVNNLFDAKYETNGWVYRYYEGNTEKKSDGYFPQAGINFMVGLELSI